MISLSDVRKKQELTVPNVLKDIHSFSFISKESTSCVKNQEEIKKLFPKTFGQPVLQQGTKSSKESIKPLNIGVVLSGGQAAGGHNVIIGLYNGLKQLNGKSRLFGFLNGPSGIVDKKIKELKDTELENYKNSGGFDLIGSGRTKIETKEQLKKSLETVKELNLDGLVIIGGDDSNTNAAVLAEYFLENGCLTKVVGVPKTIDGDLKNKWVEVSFGFDTACKTYSEMIGNIARDALSAKKYTHFIKLMGRSASHIALECALQTHPNLAFVSEEVLEKKKSLQDLVQELTEMVIKRSQLEKNYGLVLIPEGLIEFIPEIKELILALNTLLSEEKLVQDSSKDNRQIVKNQLKGHLKETFEFLPEHVQNQLLMDRDPHGNVQVSHIQTEMIFIENVIKELKRKNFQGQFSPVQHFFGYEGRAAFPSNFDATYCYALGLGAACLIKYGATGYMTCVGNLNDCVENWSVWGIPITSLMHLEKRKGLDKAVIQKALVDLDGKVFKAFSQDREKWKYDDDFIFPGPIQFFGDERLVNKRPISLGLEQEK